MTKVEMILIIGVSVMILATIGFYITLFYRFHSFINRDGDRINAFSQTCFENLYNESFPNMEEENKSEVDITGVVVSKKDIVESNSNGDNTSIDEF